MNLDCLNDIITDGLGIQIDISDIDSWDLNTGFTSVSLNQWAGAYSDNINLYDFGLTGYDNGRVDRMYSGLTLTPQDLKVTLYRVGYNNSEYVYSGETQYDIYGISAVTTGSSVGNYFELNGGYLQGFFKLQDYNFELFPPRYDEGITIETLIQVNSGSSGLFFLMGARAEDKYNPQFSGESQTKIYQEVTYMPTGIVGQYAPVVTTVTGFTGIQTSEENYLNAYIYETQVKSAFSSWENNTEEVPVQAPQSANTQNNVIALGLAQDKRIVLKYINGKNIPITKVSNRQVSTGWTLISLVFAPNEPISNYDPSTPNCFKRRLGDLIIYVNGRQFWKISDFEEFYFRGFANHKEKQLGVPYNISFGGGSFGLKHSWHYDYKTYPLYSGDNQTYIENNFIVTTNPLNSDPCYTGSTGGSYNSLGLSLSANSTTFTQPIECSTGTTGVTVMEISHTGTTGTTLSEYFIEYELEIDALSNRNLTLVANIFDTGIFKSFDSDGYPVVSSIQLIPLGVEGITPISEVIYGQQIGYMIPTPTGPYPTFDKQTYQYEYASNGIIINGTTGYPVIGPYNETVLDFGGNITGQTDSLHYYVTGINQWNTLQTTFKLPENSGLQTIKVGILLQSTDTLNDNFVLYVNDFKYIATDKLSQDENKDNLLIEQTFDSSFIGGIQKLRIYDYGFNASEALHNAKIELKNNPAYNYVVSTGGRIIYT